MSILIAENDIGLCRFYSETFGQYGLTFAMDGVDLLTKAQACRFNLLWVDLVMPLLSGTEAVRRIRNEPGPNQVGTSIIATTGLPTTEIAHEDLSVFDWIYQKPVTYDTMDKIFGWASSGTASPNASFLTDCSSLLQKDLQ